MPEEVRRPADLYAVPPEQFTAARQALVAALRQAGDTDAATEAAAIKRPTLPLWAINQLARHDQAAVTRLIEAAEQLKMAQLGRRPGGDLRAASETYQALLKRCEERGAAFLHQAAAGVTVAARNRLARTLATAAADPALRPALREGRLPHEVATAGFDVFGGARPLMRVPPPPKEEALARTAQPTKSTAKPDHEGLRRLMRARTALAEAKAAFEKAQAETARLARTATDAQQRANQAQRAAEEAKKEEEAASARVAEAERALEAEEAAKRP
jgi:hypothetical protein